MNADINFASDSFRLALYNVSGHDANTGAFTTVTEVVGTGYTSGGVLLAGVALSVDTTNNVAFVDWGTDPSFSSSTITSTDCMIYDDTVTAPTANVSCYIGDFSGSKSSSNGTFLIVFPAATFSAAIIRIA